MNCLDVGNRAWAGDSCHIPYSDSYVVRLVCHTDSYNCFHPMSHDTFRYISICYLCEGCGGWRFAEAIPPLTPLALQTLCPPRPPSGPPLVWKGPLWAGEPPLVRLQHPMGDVLTPKYFYQWHVPWPSSAPSLALSRGFSLSPWPSFEVLVTSLQCPLSIIRIVQSTVCTHHEQDAQE